MLVKTAIPNFYLIETVYGKNREKIQCKIDYKDSKPSFVIYFEKNENQISVSSNKSASGVTEKYLKVVITIHY